MPDNSNRTTNFGPLVSLTTTKTRTDVPHLFLDSNTTVTVSGRGVYSSGAVVDLADVAPLLFSGLTTASPTSSFIPDGHLSIVSHSANSIVIAIRSGATTYRFTNDAGGVL